MIKLDHYRLTHPDAPMGTSYGPLARVEEWKTRNPAGYSPDGFVVDLVDHCICCGSLKVTIAWNDGWRCERHAEKMPCQIVDCRRTTRRDKVVGNEWICSVHWRAGVPPHSAPRRVFSRFKRLMRKLGDEGWTDERIARCDRLWAWLKARCQSVANGDLDQRQIDRMFGWGE